MGISRINIPSKGAKNNELTGKQKTQLSTRFQGFDWHNAYTDALIGNNTHWQHIRTIVAYFLFVRALVHKHRLC